MSHPARVTPDPTPLHPGHPQFLLRWFRLRCPNPFYGQGMLYWGVTVLILGLVSVGLGASSASATESAVTAEPLAGTKAFDGKATSTLRIITLAPNLTEAVFALGFGDQVVADTDYCRFPPEAEERPHVGGLYNPNVELILSLRPDVVFYVPHHAELAARLEKAGLHTVVVPSETVADVISGIRIIGRTLGAERRAEKLARSIQHRVDAVTAQAARQPRKRVVLVVDHEPGSIRGLYAAGSGNYLDELLRLVGGDNMLQDTATTYPKISPEILLQDPPDVILDSRYAEATQVEGDWEPGMRRAWETLFKDSAKKPRIEFITEPRVMIPGPSIVVALGVLARAVHGKAFDVSAASVDAGSDHSSSLPSSQSDGGVR